MYILNYVVADVPFISWRNVYTHTIILLGMLFVCNEELVKECDWLQRNNKNDEQIRRNVWFEPFECKIKSGR